MFIPAKPAGGGRRRHPTPVDEAKTTAEIAEAENSYSLADDPTNLNLVATEGLVSPEAFWKSVARFSRLR